MDRKLEKPQLTGGEGDAGTQTDGQSDLLHEAQQKLRQSEAAQRDFAAMQSSILNALPAHIALLDHEGVIISVNDRWRIFAGGNGLEESISGLGQNYLSVCERAQGECAREAHAAAPGIRAVLAGTKAEFSLEYPCHSPTEHRWYRLTVNPMQRDGRHGAVVMHVDVSERKEAEAALITSEQHYHSLFENMLDGYAYCRLLYDEAGRAVDYVYLDVNRAFEPHTGLKDVAGRKVSEVVPGMHEANPEQLVIYSRVARTGQPE